jgi:hypothetical protein
VKGARPIFRQIPINSHIYIETSSSFGAPTPHCSLGSEFVKGIMSSDAFEQSYLYRNLEFIRSAYSAL